MRSVAIASLSELTPPPVLLCDLSQGGLYYSKSSDWHYLRSSVQPGHDDPPCTEASTQMALNFAVYVLVGLLAQLIDGALGMAYGVTSTTFLLTIGLPPATASASVHSAEIVTTAVSGVSHWRFGNVDRSLVLRLLIPGIIGGVTGAYLLTTIPENIIKPIVAVYLLLMGLEILRKAFIQTQEPPRQAAMVLLGLAGGFFDAIGGGGWGPIVTSTLVARGHDPRLTIGSVNLSEFFVTTCQAITFMLTIGSVLVQHWQVILGLLIGGAIGAPLAAYLTKRIAPKRLMIMVGVLIIILSIRTIFLAL